MNKQRKVKQRIKQQALRQDSNSPETEINSRKYNKLTDSKFHPNDRGYTDTEQVSDLESAQYYARGRDQIFNDNDSDVPPRFIENETHLNQNFKSVVDNQISPSNNKEQKFKVTGMMESDIEESGNIGQKIGLDQSFSTEKSLKDNLDETGSRRRGRPKSSYNKPQSQQTRISPGTSRHNMKHRKNSSSKPNFLMQNELHSNQYPINQKIRNKKRETYNKILENAYFGSNQSKSFNMISNRSRKLVSTKKNVTRSNKKKENAYIREDSDMKKTMNDHISEGSLGGQNPNRKRRVQSSYVRDSHIEEIQEEAFDSINIKTPADFNDQEENAKLMAYYRSKFAHQERGTRSAKAMSAYQDKQRQVSNTSVKSSQSLQFGLGKEDLADKLHECKVKLNKVSEDKKALNTQNKQLQREIQANEKVIQMMMKNQDPSLSASNMNHYHLMMKYKRELREEKTKNNNLQINIDQMRKNMKTSKEAMLRTENQQLLVQTQTMQFNNKRLQDNIIELKDKLQQQVKADLARSDNVDQYEMKSQIQDYKKITKKQELTIQNFEKSNLQLQDEIQGYQNKIESLKQKWETKESKLMFKLSQQELEMSTIQQLKRQLDTFKTELKQNKIVIDSFKPKIDALTRDKVTLTKERDFLNTELQNGMKSFKNQLKDKNREIMMMSEDFDSKYKSIAQKHTKEMNQLNAKLNKSLGQNRNLDELLLQKQTNISQENQLKVQVKKLEIELESLRHSKRRSSRGTTPKKKKKIAQAFRDDDDKDDQALTVNLQNEQKLLEKEYAIEKLMTKVGQLENKNKDLTKKLEDQEQKNKMIVERNPSEEQNSDKHPEENFNQQQEIEKLQIDIENLKQTINNKEQQIEDHSNNTNNIQQQLNEKNKELDSLNQQLEQIQQSLNEKNEEFDQLKEKYDSGEMDRDNLEMENQNYLNTIKEREQLLEEIRAELMDLKNNAAKDADEKNGIHDELNKQIEEHKSQINSQLNHIESLNQQLSAAQQNLDQLQDAVKNDQTGELSQQVEDLDKQLIELKNQNRELIGSNQTNDNKIQELEYAHSELQSEIQEKLNKISDLENTVQDLNNNDQNLRQQIQLNEDHIVELQEQIQNHQNLVKEKESQLQQQTEVHSQQIQNLNEKKEIPDDNQLIADLKADIDAKQQQIDELNTHLSRYQDELNQLTQQKEQEIQNLNKQIEVQEERIHNLELENEGKDINIQEHEKEYSMLSETKLRTPTSPIMFESQQSAKDLEDLKKQYLEVKNHLEEASYEKEQLQAEIQELREQLQSRAEPQQQEPPKDLVDKLANLQSENEELRQKIENFEEQDYVETEKKTKKLNTQQSSQSIGVSDGDQSSKLNNMNHEIEVFKNQAAEANDKLYQVQQELDDKSNEINEIQMTLKDTQNDNERLQTEIQNVEGDLKEAKNEIQELKQEIKAKEIDYKKIVTDLDKANESKNQLFEKLMAEKDSKNSMLQEFAQGNYQMAQSVNSQSGPSPKNKKSSSMKVHKELDIETKMDKVNEEASQENVSEEEEQENHYDLDNHKKNTDEDDSEDENYAPYVESSDNKSVISIDNVEDANPSDNEDYEKLYLKASKNLGIPQITQNDQSMVTIEEYSQSQRTDKSGFNENVANFIVEDNPPDPMIDNYKF